MRGMRKLYLVPVFASAIAGLYACTTDPDPEPQFQGIDAGNGSPDTGTTPPVIIDGSVPPTDGGIDVFVLPDAQPDAQPDAALPIVVLLLGADNKPLPQTDVYFTPTGGAPIKATSGADGRATFAPGEGSIAVGTTFDNGETVEWSLNTVAGVKSGDLIRINTTRSDSYTELGKVTGTIAGNPANTTVAVDDGFCGYTSLQAAAFEYFPYKSCLDATGKATLLFVARNAQFEPVSYAVKQVAVATDGGLSAAANVAAADWQPVTSKNAPLQGTLPAWADEYSRYVQFPLGNRTYAEHYSNPADDGTTFPVWAPPAAAFPNAFLQIDAQQQDFGEVRTSARYRRVGNAASYGDDYAVLLPRISGAKAAGTTTAPIVSWTADAALGGDAVGAATLSGYYTAPNDDGHDVSWHAVFPVPNNGTSVTLPPVPAALTSYITDAQEPWAPRRVGLAVSSQFTYAQAHQVPSVFESPGRYLSELPGAGDLELRVTQIRGNRLQERNPRFKGKGK